MSQAPRRVLITGSRTWQNHVLIGVVLYDIMRSCHTNGRALVVVHGACPTGADRMAAEAVQRLAREGYAVSEEAYPANWQRDGKRAGPMRNQFMASKGADLCIAFWDGASAGTKDMIQQATAADIPTVIACGDRHKLLLLQPLFASFGAE